MAKYTKYIKAINDNLANARTNCNIVLYSNKQKVLYKVDAIMIDSQGFNGDHFIIWQGFNPKDYHGQLGIEIDKITGDKITRNMYMLISSKSSWLNINNLHYGIFSDYRDNLITRYLSN